MFVDFASVYKIKLIVSRESAPGATRGPPSISHDAAYVPRILSDTHFHPAGPVLNRVPGK
jgi:hypothetical protein